MCLVILKNQRLKCFGNTQLTEQKTLQQQNETKKDEAENPELKLCNKHISVP